MKLNFFDANIYAGRSLSGTYEPVVTAYELNEYLDTYGMDRALAWHVSQLEYSPDEGNDMISAMVSCNDRLFGCWTIMPPQSDEINCTDEFFKRMKNDRIIALRAFPEQHNYFLNKLVFGDFMGEIVRRRIPLLLSLKSSLRPMWQCIYDILDDYPDLVCVICDSVFGDRYSRPLLENYKNVYLETSYISCCEGEIESFVEKYGARRLVFGSCFPERIPESAMLQLVHAEISDEHKNLIASGNMERLIKELIL